MSLAHCRLSSCAHAYIRDFAIRSQITQAEGPTYLVIGDSITEAASLRSVCGRSPINAGIGGATVHTFRFLAAELAAMAMPDAVVIALGTNDSYGQKDPAAFSDAYRALVHGVQTSRPLILVPIPAVEAGPVGSLHAGGNELIQAFNRSISSIGTDLNATLANPLSALATTDGIHLAASAQREWRQNLEAAVGRALGCS